MKDIRKKFLIILITIITFLIIDKSAYANSFYFDDIEIIESMTGNKFIHNNTTKETILTDGINTKIIKAEANTTLDKAIDILSNGNSKTKLTKIEDFYLANPQKSENINRFIGEKLYNGPVKNAKIESVLVNGIDAMEIWDRIEENNFSNNGNKWMFLTFDDGPSYNVTPVVLDTLRKYDIKATFFIPGNVLESDVSREILKTMYEEGHSICNHSYSHNYSYLYPGRNANIENFLEEFDKTQMAFKNVLGDNFSTSIIRAPGGLMSWNNIEPLKAALKERGIAGVDWNAHNADGMTNTLSVDESYTIATKSAGNMDVVVMLMHDSPAKMTTAQSLDRMIEYFINKGYEFKILI